VCNLVGEMTMSQISSEPEKWSPSGRLQWAMSAGTKTSFDRPVISGPRAWDSRAELTGTYSQRAWNTGLSKVVITFEQSIDFEVKNYTPA
jgi:hypothetical protein